MGEKELSTENTRKMVSTVELNEKYLQKVSKEHGEIRGKYDAATGSTDYKLLTYPKFIKEYFEDIHLKRNFLLLLLLIGLFLIIFIGIDLLLYPLAYNLGMRLEIWPATSAEFSSYLWTNIIPGQLFFILSSVSLGIFLFCLLGRISETKKYILVLLLVLTIWVEIEMMISRNNTIFAMVTYSLNPVIYYLLATLLQIELTPSGMILHVITFLLDSRASRKLDIATKKLLDGIERLFNARGANIVFKHRNSLVERLKQEILTNTESMLLKFEKMVENQGLKQFLLLNQNILFQEDENGHIPLYNQKREIESIIDGKKKKETNTLVAKKVSEDHYEAFKQIVTDLKEIINNIGTPDDEDEDDPDGLDSKKLKKGRTYFDFENKTLLRTISRQKTTFLGIAGSIITFIISLL